MFEAVMERTAWGGGEMGSMPTPRPPQASALGTHEPSSGNIFAVLLLLCLACQCVRPLTRAFTAANAFKCVCVVVCRCTKSMSRARTRPT